MKKFNYDNEPILIGDTAEEMWNHYQSICKIYPSINYDSVFKLNKTEFHKFIDLYDKSVEEDMKKMFGLIDWLQYAPYNQENRENIGISGSVRLVIPEEYHLLNLLKNLHLTNKRKALHIPSFKEQILFEKIYGCTTAFITSNPTRIFFTKGLYDYMSKLGHLFILLHEAQHYTRFHSDRKFTRKHFIWNVATDSIINHDLLNNKIPKICQLLGLPEFQVNQLFHPENEYGFDFIGVEHYFPEIFNEQIEKGLTFFNFAEQGFIEEEIYKKIHSIMNKDDVKTDNHFGEGIDMAKEFADKSLKDIFKKIFGEHADEMEKEFWKFINENGLPRNEGERNSAIEADAKLNNSWKKNYAKDMYGNNSENLEFLKEREKEVDKKLKFQLFINNFVKKLNQNSIHFEKGQKLNKISQLSKYPDVNSVMGFNTQIKLYQREPVSSYLKLLCILDTSGSVGNYEYKYMLNALYDLVQFHNLEIYVCPADTASNRKTNFIINKKNIKEYDEKGFPLQGGGGTDMLEPLANELAFAQLNGEHFDLALILSDGEYQLFNENDVLKQMAYYFDKNAKNNTNQVHKTFSRNAKSIPHLVFLHTNEQFYQDNNLLLKSFKNKAQEFILDRDSVAKIG